MNILWAVIEGAIIGFLAQLIIPGRSQTKWWMTLILGIGGAILGNYIAGWIGVRHTRGIDWIRHLLQLGCAIVLIALAYPAFAKASGGVGTKDKLKEGGQHRG
ncbi:signal peptidase [Mangrovactinospora gilvigrisea]|uniref:Signal peptidase n=1 Tax=Mangrovactinospora gilvigrisea TaxID=1428644 RepID=A0A1J7C6T6_9ACTN|nr:GlsB/YeaQ/YmgE family stress response membrane protein [Mangrovactinospora gilvigrisea]OIV37244.1 signal peptidase [Mangrovactinospora gilvigrisea]